MTESRRTRNPRSASVRRDRRDGTPRALSLLDATFTKVGAVATSLSAAAGIGWAVWHFAYPPAPAQLEAHVAGIPDGFAPGISLKQFFARDRTTGYEDGSAYSKEQLNCRFAYLQVRVTVDGYSGQQVWLRWLLSDDRGNEIGDVLEDELQPLTVQRAHDSDIVSNHLLLPARPNLRLRVQLYRKHDGQLLQFSEPYVTPSFEGPRVRQSSNCPA